MRSGPAPREKDWLIIFLVQADNVNIIHVKNMIDDAALNYSTKSVFHIFIDTTKDAVLMLEPSLSGKVPAEMSVHQNGLFWLELKYRSGTREVAIDYIDMMPEFDITKQEDLTRCLSDVWKLQSSRRIMVVTWDHGGFFGIFRKENKVNPIFRLGYDSLLPGALHCAFRNAFGRKKVSLLLMMNCNTNVINFAFSLHRSVQYLIAAPTEMYESGYNYKAVFADMHTSSARDIAAGATRSQGQITTTSQRNNWSHIQSNDQRLLLVALSLRHINEMTFLLDNVVSCLVASIKSQIITKDEMILCLAGVLRTGHTNYGLQQIDFHSLIEMLGRMISGLINKDIERLKVCVRNSVIGYFAGEELKEKLKNAGHMSPAFSTYYVPDRETFEESIEYLDFIRESARNATEYSKARLWDNFMSFLYSDHL